MLGYGRKFSFQFNLWCEGISTVEKFSKIIIKDAEVKKNAKVCDLWKNGSWVFLVC